MNTDGNSHENSRETLISFFLSEHRRLNHFGSEMIDFNFLTRTRYHIINVFIDCDVCIRT